MVGLVFRVENPRRISSAVAPCTLYQPSPSTVRSVPLNITFCMPEWNVVGHVLQYSTDLAVLCAVWSDSIVCTDSGNEASCGHLLAYILKDVFQSRKKYLRKA